MSRAPSLSVAMVVLFVAPSFAKTWYVGWWGADFSEIQPAIDAAQDGDVILVREGGSQAFTLDKGVMIRAASVPFKMVNNAEVHVRDIAPGTRAGVSGISLSADGRAPER